MTTPPPGRAKSIDDAVLALGNAHAHAQLSEAWAYAAEEFLEVMSLKLIAAGVVDVTDVNAVREDLLEVRREVKQATQRYLGCMTGVEGLR